MLEDAAVLARAVAEAASRHYCTARCSWDCPAGGGEPPPGFMRRAARYLAPLGYRLIRNATTLGRGQDGEVVGAFTQDDGQRFAMTMRVAKGLSPAREFAVTAHELSHVILGHPSHTYAEAVAETQRRARWFISSGGVLTENPHSEMSCELASAVTLARAGLRPDPRHACYLSQRQLAYGVSLHDQLVTEKAKEAADVLSEVLL